MQQLNVHQICTYLWLNNLQMTKELSGISQTSLFVKIGWLLLVYLSLGCVITFLIDFKDKSATDILLISLPVNVKKECYQNMQSYFQDRHCPSRRKMNK